MAGTAVDQSVEYTWRDGEKSTFGSRVCSQSVVSSHDLVHGPMFSQLSLLPHGSETWGALDGTSNSSHTDPHGETDRAQRVEFQHILAVTRFVDACA